MSFNEAAAELPRKMRGAIKLVVNNNGFNEAAAELPRKSDNPAGIVITDKLQ